jgi:hypothetical protein
MKIFIPVNFPDSGGIFPDFHHPSRLWFSKSSIFSIFYVYLPFYNNLAQISNL